MAGNHRISANLPIDVLRDGKAFIAYCPVLDLPAAGKSYEDALEKFEEVAEAFLEELSKAGTLEDYLTEMGWTKRKGEWSPPILVGHTERPVTASL